MHRRDFISKGCSACIAGTGLSMLFTACQSTRYISGTLNKNGLIVSADEFKINRKGGAGHLSFIIVRNEALLFPIYVYRFSDTIYSAVWMKCSHQGNELQASGDYLQCPAHGSEFNNKGEVTNGPAERNLKIFSVSKNKSELFIDLRKA